MSITVKRLFVSAYQTVQTWSPPTPQQGATQQRFLDLLDRSADAIRADHPDAHITASAVVVAASRDQVLLCLHGRFGIWVQLGGHCEDTDESLYEAAGREAQEESGIDGLIVDPVPIDLDIHQVNCRYGQVLHYDVRFVALAPPDALAQVSSESRELGWFAPHLLPSPLARTTDRVVAAALHRLG